MIRWLARLAARTLRHDTYRAMVEPALADAEFESAMAGRMAAGRRVLAVASTFVLAALHDVRLDARTTYGSGAIRTIWLPAIGWAVLYVAAMWSPTGSGRWPGLSGSAITLWIVAAVVPVIAASAVFMLARRSHARVGTIAAAIAGVTAASILTTVALRFVLSRDLGPSLDPRYLWESARMLALVPLVGLVGLSLSYSRGWRIGGRLILVVIGFYLLDGALPAAGVGGLPATIIAMLVVTIVSLRVRPRQADGLRRA